jgi:hypothetical protein
MPDIISHSLSLPRHTRSLSISSTKSDTSVVTADQAGGDALGSIGAPTINTLDRKNNDYQEAAAWASSQSTQRDPTQQLTIFIGQNLQAIGDASTRDKDSQEQRGRPEAEHNKDEGTDVEVQVSLPNPTSLQLEELADFFSERNMSFKFEKVSASHEQKESRPLDLVVVGSFTVLAILSYAQSFAIYKMTKHLDKNAQKGAKRQIIAPTFKEYFEVIKSLGNLGHLKWKYVGLRADWEKFCELKDRYPNGGQADPLLDEKSGLSAV